MSGLRFLADEDLRYEIVLAVRRLEPSIEFATVQERALGGKSDAEVLEASPTPTRGLWFLTTSIR